MPIYITFLEKPGFSPPSFVLPYLAGFADDAEHALFLRKFSVPFRVLCKDFLNSLIINIVNHNLSGMSMRCPVPTKVKKLAFFYYKLIFVYCK